ncbi:tyrosine-protein phosphatase non-receptor type 3 isoform X1 [Sardina pilchardus]|uniref:tyrosine-protein phosphatase non-receptor type 3 isoform X1 n=1 Tax=Sardina pilchardus TaxID=27697 RepID=UPI002E143CD6
MPLAELLCVVLFPDGDTHTFHVNKQQDGSGLFSAVCAQLSVQDTHYYSLLISENTLRETSPRWLEQNKPLKKQLKGPSPFFLSFRVRFFVSDPNSLQHEQTRHFYFLQIKRDIQEGRLKCPLSSAVVLASYAVQSELGDHKPETPSGYLSKAHFLPEQNEDFLPKVEALHPQHRGLSQCEAELCFLNTARTLELYGVELHVAKDENKSTLWVGIASGGVALFCNLICTSFFPWINIIKISFKRKRFCIHLRRKHGEVGEQVVSVCMQNSRNCKNLWRSCVDHHTFYQHRNTHPSPTSRPLYRRLVTGKLWDSALKSGSSEHLETQSLPSRSPPSTPTWRSPRMRHDVHKPRPSSVDNLTGETSDGTETEEVFYTYRKVQDDNTTSTFTPQHDEVITGEEEESPWEKGVVMDGDLLLVRISPDPDGKFGFNVKGGVDQKMPLVISHVNPDSPAAQCTPAVCVGDELVLVNGRDVSEHTHQQVVMFIRASRETHTNHLTLLLRRRAGVSLRAVPSLQIDLGLSMLGEISETANQAPGQSLEESMTRLERGVMTGTLLMQFEKLYRRKPGLTYSSARLPENTEKNRYKDVLPYDITRVVLKGDGDDYINANHVKTEPGGGVLRYIAAQGPLPVTCTHFWRCVWEQNSTHIIMLTTLTERGRTKCHQYWPHPPEVREYGNLQVCCHSEEGNLTYVTREFTLTNTQTDEQRSVTHLQYVAWPDHGTPDDASDFLSFIQSVRSRKKRTSPLMVHCSAGIGRTGVLITMETALVEMEAGEPVCPLQIVQSLREQRAMMVQTPCQFRFVCEAILKVYRDKHKTSGH